MFIIIRIRFFTERKIRKISPGNWKIWESAFFLGVLYATICVDLLNFSVHEESYSLANHHSSIAVTSLRREASNRNFEKMWNCKIQFNIGTKSHGRSHSRHIAHFCTADRIHLACTPPQIESPGPRSLIQRYKLSLRNTVFLFVFTLFIHFQ